MNKRTRKALEECVAGDLTLEELFRKWHIVESAAKKILAERGCRTPGLHFELSQRCAEWLLRRDMSDVVNAYKLAYSWMRQQATWPEGARGSFMEERRAFEADPRRPELPRDAVEQEWDGEDRHNLGIAVREFVKTLPEPQRLVFATVFEQGLRVKDTPTANPFAEYRRLKKAAREFFGDAYIQ